MTTKICRKNKKTKICRKHIRQKYVAKRQKYVCMYVAKTTGQKMSRKNKISQTQTNIYAMPQNARWFFWNFQTFHVHMWASSAYLRNIQKASKLAYIESLQRGSLSKETHWYPKICIFSPIEITCGKPSYTYIYIYIYIYIYMYVRMYVCIHTCKWECACIHHLSTCMHT